MLSSKFSKFAVVLLVSLALPSGTLGQCDVCQTEVKAACHGETSFSICMDGVPTEDYINCPADYHCTGGKYICYPKETGTVNCKPGNTARDPTTICKEAQEPYQFTNEMDPTCTTFVQCDEDDNGWIGVVLNCMEGQWFNGEFCESTKPEFCT